MKAKIIFISIVATIFFIACKEEYNVKIDTPVTGYLVVEGFANLTPNSVTTIILSRTTKLTNSNIQYEQNAQVYLEDDNNSSYTLSMYAAGIYSSSPLTLDPQRKYRIHVITKDAKEYKSAFIESKISPEIDSISWAIKNNGVQIYANTHDDQNKTIYYLWNYSETWEYHAAYQSMLVYDPVNVTFITRDLINNNINTCWKTDASSNIIVGSSAKLSRDVIFQKPVAFVSASDNKLVRLYSIQMHQYALSKDAYNYLDLMRKNTEQLGSIFDAQPSELIGNIHNVNDSTEIVVGFFYSSSVTEKRKFIYRSEVHGLNISSEMGDCKVDTVVNNKDSIKAVFESASCIGIYWIYGIGPVIKSYTYTTSFCADCRLQGGTTTKPSFWP